MAKLSTSPLQASPFIAYREPKTGQWVIDYPSRPVCAAPTPIQYQKVPA